MTGPAMEAGFCCLLHARAWVMNPPAGAPQGPRWRAGPAWRCGDGQCLVRVGALDRARARRLGLCHHFHGAGGERGRCDRGQRDRLVAGTLGQLPRGARRDLLTFLAGAEIDPTVVRKHFWSSMSIGIVGFLAPYLGVVEQEDEEKR